MKLVLSALTKLILGFIVITVLLFAPAGTFAFPGAYGIVRHPMYTSTIGMFLCMPLVMGSWWAFIIMLPYIPIIMFRIKDEETMLSDELTGYTEYKQKVKWKLFTHIW